MTHFQRVVSGGVPAVLLWFISSTAFAVDSTWLPGECRPLTGTKSYIFNFNKTITNIIENQDDQEYGNAYTWKDSSNYISQCNCPNDWNGGPVYWKGESSLPFHKEINGKKFYKINDKLAFSMRTYIWNKGLINVPFNEGNSGSGREVCSTVNTTTGSEGVVDLLVIKPFLGQEIIPLTELFNLYGTLIPNAFGTYPSAKVSMVGSVTVNQSCEVNAGQAIQVDFGDMFNGNFKGQGSKPEGVATKTLQLGYKCNLVSQGMNVSMKFTGQNDSQYPTAFATTNQDIGVVIEDGNGNRLQPNTGSLPMTVDYNTQTGSVNITTYPVSTTGKIPIVGQFTSRATVVVDFQ